MGVANHLESEMWSREHTKEWLIQIGSRLEDFEYYLKQTTDWCELHGIWNDAAIFMCCVMTLVWVSYQRNEPLSKTEVFEILGFDQNSFGNDMYELGKEFQDLDHESLLYRVIKNFHQEEE